ncbi:MAG: hypothetical protein PVG41_03460 [Desulfobacteraceae bacterium]|jgi:hypothetical protein
MKVLDNFYRKSKSWLGICLVLSFLYLLSGCWVKDIDTPYYTQDTSYYCGAASAQMILDSENLGIYVSPQSSIYNYIHSHNICAGWASDPEGLKDGLNHFAGGAAWFTWYAPTGQDDGNNKLAYTIDRYGVPPAALTYGSAHWVVVRGVVTSDQPTIAPAYDIYFFGVNDPWYGATSLGGDKWIDIRTWNDEVFTGGSWCGAPGGPRFISVVDPEPPTEAKISYPAMQKRRTVVYKSEEIEEMAANFLEKILSSKAFREYYDDNTIKNLSLSSIGTAKLVSRLDLEKEAYYTVPLIAKNGERRSMVQGALLFDAYRGQFKEMSVVDKAVSYVLVDNEDYARKLFDKQYDMRSKGVTKLTDFDLVWLPSKESRSPFHPFWQAKGVTKYSDKPMVLAYMDQEGKLFDGLTPLAKAKTKGGGF